ncbi:unnamed protein product, partial [marine sediment metagenome]
EALVKTINSGKTRRSTSREREMGHKEMTFMKYGNKNRR